MSNQGKASQRNELMEALEQAGLQPSEFTSAGGKTYVVVRLIDSGVTPIINTALDPELRAYFQNAAKGWPHRAYLFICSGSQSAPWEVGVIGHNGHTGEDYTPPEQWVEKSTTAEAVDVFRQHWENRDSLLNAFMSGLVK